MSPPPPTAEDGLFIEALEFTGPHGVFPEERAHGCRFRVDLKLAVDLGTAGFSDRLADTVDYGRVAEVVVAAGGPPSVWLVERRAARLADAGLAGVPGVRVVDLTLRKLDPPVVGRPSAVGVRLRRARPAA